MMMVIVTAGAVGVLLVCVCALCPGDASSLTSDNLVKVAVQLFGDSNVTFVVFGLFYFH